MYSQNSSLQAGADIKIQIITWRQGNKGRLDFFHQGLNEERGEIKIVRHIREDERDFGKQA